MIELRRPVLIGVSYIIPFVVVGGLLQAIGLLLGARGAALDPAAVLTGTPAPSSSVPDLLYTLGTLAFSLLAPVLAGSIAYAIADRPGIMPGLTTGLAAGAVGAGFLGALIGGVLAGVLAERLGRVPMPSPLTGLASFLVVPLTATLVSGAAMLAVIGPPVAAAGAAMTTWLTGLGGSSAVLLGVVLGAMTVADLGGPLNKAAYTFAMAGMTGATSGRAMSVMAVVMAAGMTAPLACWLATRLRPAMFTPEEREQGKAAGVLGAVFISEGAIPFAAANPLRVIPGLVAGGAVAGAATMAVGATLAAPHGGVLALFAVGHLLGFLASLASGAAIAAALLVFMRPRARPARRADRPVAAPETAGQ